MLYEVITAVLSIFPKFPGSWIRSKIKKAPGFSERNSSRFFLSNVVCLEGAFSATIPWWFLPGTRESNLETLTL